MEVNDGGRGRRSSENAFSPQWGSHTHTHTYDKETGGAGVAGGTHRALEGRRKGVCKQIFSGPHSDLMWAGMQTAQGGSVCVRVCVRLKDWLPG